MSKFAFRVAGSGNFKTGYKTPDAIKYSGVLKNDIYLPKMA